MGVYYTRQQQLPCHRAHTGFVPSKEVASKAENEGRQQGSTANLPLCMYCLPFIMSRLCALYTPQVERFIENRIIKSRR